LRLHVQCTLYMYPRKSTTLALTSKQVALKSKQVFQVKRKVRIWKSVVVDLNARKTSNLYQVIVIVQSYLTLCCWHFAFSCLLGSCLVVEKQFLHSLFGVLLVASCLDLKARVSLKTDRSFFNATRAFRSTQPQRYMPVSFPNWRRTSKQHANLRRSIWTHGVASRSAPNIDCRLCIPLYCVDMIAKHVTRALG